MTEVVVKEIDNEETKEETIPEPTQEEAPKEAPKEPPVAHSVWFLIGLAKRKTIETIAMPFPLSFSKSFKNQKMSRSLNELSPYIIIFKKLFFSSWERIPPLELQDSNNKLQSNNKLLAATCGPFCLVPNCFSKRKKIETIAMLFPLSFLKKFQTSKNEEISKRAVPLYKSFHFFSSWERIPPLEVQESNNELQSNNKLPGSHLWPILPGF